MKKWRAEKRYRRAQRGRRGVGPAARRGGAPQAVVDRLAEPLFRDRHHGDRSRPFASSSRSAAKNLAAASRRSPRLAEIDRRDRRLGVRGGASARRRAAPRRPHVRRIEPEASPPARSARRAFPAPAAVAIAAARERRGRAPPRSRPAARPRRAAASGTPSLEPDDGQFDADRRRPGVEDDADRLAEVGGDVGRVVGLTWPERLALGAASGPPKPSSSACATGCAGTRTATVSSPAVTRSAIPALRPLRQDQRQRPRPEGVRRAAPPRA